MQHETVNTSTILPQKPSRTGPAHILGCKDATGFISNPGRIRVNGEDVDIQSTEIRHTFPEMIALRKANQKRDRDEVVRDMEAALTSEEGFIPANLGVSLYVTTRINNERYAVLVYQDRGATMDDRVYKLISGYVDADGQPSLLHALSKTVTGEANEEVLPSNGQRKMLSCSVIAAKELVVKISEDDAVSGSINEVEIGPAYPDRFHYEDNLRWKLISSNNLGALPGLFPVRGISVDGIPILNTGIEFDAAVGSAQLIFGFELRLPEDTSGLTIAHAEDAPDPHKGPGHLVTEYHEGGLVLVRLDNEGRLTDESFWLYGGELIPTGKGNITLSEIFSPCIGMTTRQQNIALNEYLQPA